MQNQTEAARIFHGLHIKGDPVILFNIWDPGSAKAVEDAGAKAIATGSWPVAVAHGFADGEQIPLDLAMENLSRIIKAVGLPVTVDLEGGYGAEPHRVAEAMARAVETGAVGFNFEDQIVGGSGLYDVAVQTSRISAARSASDIAGQPAFINARTDLFLKAKPDSHTDAMLNEAIERAKAYEQAGANGFFAPGLCDESLIGQLCDATALPVNIIALPHVPNAKVLAGLGVARISYGPVPYKRMAQWLEDEARQALGSAK